MNGQVGFSYIALFLGFCLWVTVILGGQQDVDQRTYFPLLALLVISEFAFFLTLFGGGIMLKTIISEKFTVFRLIVCILCFLLSIEFLRLGLYLWPNT